MRPIRSLVPATLSGLCVLWALSGAVDAQAQPAATSVASPAPRQRLLHWIEPTARGPRAAATSNVVFLNNCIATNGCALLPGRATGENDSRTNISSIVAQPALLEKWRFTPTQWDNLVTCVRDVFAPFELQIVTTEPPATTEYFEAMVAGRASQVGMEEGVAGVAPFNCGVIDNAITFSFANDYAELSPSSAGDLCWTVAQEVAHAFGLQHKYDARDPMTYLPPSLPIKLFLNESGPCGTSAARNCTQADQFEPRGCPGPTTINSYQQIAAIFGDKPGTPPSLAVTSPIDGAELTRGFVVRATAGDDVRLRDVAVTLDGTPVGPAMRGGPFEWRTPKTLPAGAHQLSVVATDYYGAVTTVVRNLTTRADCTGKATGCDRGQLCLEGRCVDGPSLDGGLGKDCTTNADCTSGLCASSGGDKRCVEDCTLGASACPDAFQCIAAAGAGVCWPDDDDGGCAADGGSSHGPLALGLAFAFLVLAPRRRARAAARPAAGSSARP
ncbi:MAG: hypothetical protein IPI49_28450 [Myxococcales bacterium]|nr:hypothetical protein [Myxococcales bacterium]HRC56142.1 Ig-like domain-containing protein [Kofleriaceae bacterium]